MHRIKILKNLAIERTTMPRLLKKYKVILDKYVDSMDDVCYKKKNIFTEI